MRRIIQFQDASVESLAVLRKAQKAHVCADCGEIIPARQQYVDCYEACGEVERGRYCLTCAAAQGFDVSEVSGAV